MAESNSHKPQKQTQVSVTLIRKDFYRCGAKPTYTKKCIEKSTPRVCPEPKRKLLKEILPENDCLDNNSEVVWEPGWGDLTQPFEQFKNFEPTKSSSRSDRKQNSYTSKQDKLTDLLNQAKDRLDLRKPSIDSLRRKEEKELEQCTFKPQLTKKGKEMAQGDRFSRLYEDAFNRRSRMKKKNEQIHQAECPFAPRINIYSSTYSFREIDNQSIPSDSAEESNYSFRPTIGRPPKMRNNNSNEIGKHLYSMSLGKKNNPLAVKVRNSVAKQSEKLYNKMKYRKFREIFEDLKPENGLIHKNSIWKVNLGVKITDILIPIFQEMEDRMGFEEFKFNLDFLIKLLCVTDRQEVLKYKQKSTSNLHKELRSKHLKSKSSMETSKDTNKTLNRLSFINNIK